MTQRDRVDAREAALTCDGRELLHLSLLVLGQHAEVTAIEREAGEA